MDGFNTFEKQDKVLLGLNSGSDAAAAMRILQQQGFAVQTFTRALAFSRRSPEGPQNRPARRAGHSDPIRCRPLRANYFVGAGIARPCSFAAAANTPGGYGICPYGAGVDACIDPKGRAPLSPNIIP